MGLGPDHSANPALGTTPTGGLPAAGDAVAPLVNDEDAVLAASAMAGDRAALETLWRRYRRWAAAIILAHKDRDADVDDLLQDVAVAVVAKIGTLSDPSAFKPWLRMVALNAARLSGRRANALPRRTGESAAENLAADHPAGAEAAMVGEDARRVLEAAQGLPVEYREPLLLRTACGLGYAQIAAITGLPETTIETRIARGRRMLRERLSDSTPPGGGGGGAARASGGRAGGGANPHVEQVGTPTRAKPGVGGIGRLPGLSFLSASGARAAPEGGAA